MKLIIALLVSGIFTNNIITTQLLGIEELENNKKTRLIQMLKHCGLITALLLVSTLVIYPVQKWVLTPLNLSYLSAFVSLLLVCGIIFAAFFLSRKFLPGLYKFLKENSRAFSCSPIVLGLSLLNINNELITGYLTALLYAVITGIGFAVVSVIFCTVSERLSDAQLPDAVNGLPLTLIIASLISLAFGGFAGI